MKLTLIFILTCSLAFGQKKLMTGTTNHDGITVECSPCPGITVTDEVRLNQLGLDRKIDLSKGEQFTEKEWQEYYKQMAPYVKMFFKRDSSHSKWLNNTLIPHLNPGDTVDRTEIKDGILHYHLKEPYKPKH